MARNYYKDGMPLGVRDRKEKFARYNIGRDLNTTYNSYQIKGGVFTDNSTDEDIGNTLSALLNRIRLTGDTEILFNLTKDKNLFPAGRLKAIKGRTQDSPVFATDGEGAVFADSENLSFSAKQDIINLGGKDQIRFITEDELTTPDPIPGDRRNVGTTSFDDATNVYSMATPLNASGRVLVWVNNKEFRVIEDMSSKDVRGNYIISDPISNFKSSNIIHDIKWLRISEGALNQKKDIILCLYNDGNELLLSEIEVDSNKTVPTFDNFNTKNLMKYNATGLKPKIINSIDDYYYIHNKNDNSIIKSDKNSLEVTIHTLDKSFEHIIETKEKLLGFHRGEFINKTDDFENDFKKYTQKEKLVDTGLSATRRGTVTAEGEQVDFEVDGDDLKVHFYDISGALITTTIIQNVPSKIFLEEDDQAYYIIHKPERKSILYEWKSKISIIEKNTHKLIRTLRDLNENEPGVFPIGQVDFSSSFPYFGVFLHNNFLYSRKGLEYATVYKCPLHKDVEEKDFNHPEEFYSSAKWTENNLTFFLGQASWYKNYNGLGAVGDLGRPNGARPLKVGEFNFNVFTEQFEERTWGISDEQTKKTGDFFYSNSQGETVWTKTEIVGTQYKDVGFQLYKGDGSLASELLIPDADNFSFPQALSENYSIVTKKGTKIIYLIKHRNKDGKMELINTGIINENKYGSTPVNKTSYSDRIRNKYFGNYIYISGKIYSFYEFNNNNQFLQEIDKKTFVSRTRENKRDFLDVDREVIITDGIQKDTGENIITGSGYVAYLNYSDARILHSLDLIYADEKDAVQEVFDIQYNPEHENIGEDITMLGIAVNKNTLLPISKNYGTEDNPINGNITLLSLVLSNASNIKKSPKVYKNDDATFPYLNIKKELEINGIEDRIFTFGTGKEGEKGNGIIAFTGENKGQALGSNGTIHGVWPIKNPDTNEDPLGAENRDIDKPGGNEIKGQQIFLTRSIRSTPTGAGGINHYDYDASRVDIPKFKNNDGKYINFKFFLDAAIKGVNVKYMDFDAEAFVAWNKLEFLDKNEDIIPFKIVDTNWETGHGLSDAEILNPDLFNDGLGNQAWNIHKAYPIVNGSQIKWEFWDVTTKRYYDILFETLSNNGGLSALFTSIDLPLFGLNESIKKTMIPGSNYLEFSSGLAFLNIFRSFSNDFMKAMYAGTVGAQPNDENSKNFATIEGNYGLDLADNRFYSFVATTTNPPLRRWPNALSLMIMDSFQTEPIEFVGVALPFRFYFSAPILNPKLFDKEGRHTSTYKELKNDLIRGQVQWNGTLFDKNFVDNNGGDLTTIVKDPNVNNWVNSSGEDAKYLMLLPNTLEELEKGIKQSGSGENPQQFKTIDVASGIGSGVAPFRVNVPVAEGMYSRLTQAPFVTPSICEELGLRTNSKIRIEFEGERAPNRIRINGFGGRNWTITEWDEVFELAKDEYGEEVIPRTFQSPNLQLIPSSSFKDISLSL